MNKVTTEVTNMASTEGYSGWKKPFPGNSLLLMTSTSLSPLFLYPC